MRAGILAILIATLVGIGLHARAQVGPGGPVANYVVQQGSISANQPAMWASNNTIMGAPNTMIQSVPISGGTATPNIFTIDVTFTPGSISALVANVKTTTVTGLLTTDALSVNAVSGLPLGANLANARVSATNTLELTITTAVVIGVTLGSTTFRITVFRA